MKNMSLERWAQWKKRRRQSFVGFLIVGTVIGMDYSFMFTTLYVYLRDTVKTGKPGLLYGLTISIYLAASFVFGAIFGRLVDRYRKVKLFTNITLVLQIIGILLYVIPKGIAYPMLGRLVSGIGDPYASICAGEVVRVYDLEDATSCLWWLSACYSFGFMIGPVVVIFFKNVDFYIGSLHFNQLNGVGILLAVVLFLVLIAVNFLIHDCSAMMDLRTNFKDSSVCETNGDIIRGISTKTLSFDNLPDISEETSLLNSLSTKKAKYYSQGSLYGIDNEYSVSVNYSWSANYSAAEDSNKHFSKSSWELRPLGLVLTDLFTHADVLLMFVSTFVFVYSLFAVDVLIPLLTGLVLEWNLTSISLIFVANGMSYIIMVMVSSKICVTDRAVYNMMIISIVSIVLLFVIVILLHFLKRHKAVSILLMSVFVIFLGLGWFVEEVLIRCTLAKMVPSNYQSFVEALRHGVSQAGMILAAVTVPIFLRYYKIWCTGIIVSNIVLLLVFLRRRNSLLMVREVEFRAKHPVKKNVSFVRSEALSLTV